MSLGRCGHRGSQTHRDAVQYGRTGQSVDLTRVGDVVDAHAGVGSGDFVSRTASVVAETVRNTDDPAHDVVGDLDEAVRLQALESIAFVRNGSAADAMVDIANLATDKAVAEKVGQSLPLAVD